MSGKKDTATTSRLDDQVKAASKNEAGDLWSLDDAFPDVASLLLPSEHVNAADPDVLVVLDANTLLLLFRIARQELSQIEKVYEKLLKAKRLYVPSRALREFVRNRDQILTEVEKMLRDKGSAIGGGQVEIPPLLEGVAETQAVKKAMEDLKKAQRAYQKAIVGLGQLIRGWRGDDPVTAMYQKHFKAAVIVESELSREEIAKQWRMRLARKVPPGYKDASNSDEGIGDFLIWLSIMKLAATEKKNLIFVTCEEKGDWFVRVDNEAIYPRPELVDEYRRGSGGKHLRLAKLADLLLDMEAPETLVREVRVAELALHNTLMLADRMYKYELFPKHVFHHSVEASDKIGFDYSKRGGMIALGDNSEFELRFSKGSNGAIYLYRTQSVPMIACPQQLPSGREIKFEQFDSSSSVYSIGKGEVFLAKNVTGGVLAGRVLEILDDIRGAAHDWVMFEYRIFGPGEVVAAP